MIDETRATLAMEKYADMVRRICFLHLRDYHDTEDVFQEVFLKYVLRNRPFENAEHEKAWLIRVSINACKDLLKNVFRRKVCSIEDVDPGIPAFADSERTVLDAVLNMPPKYRDAIYLFYYEGYAAVEIAKMLNENENTIYTRLSRAKAKLRDALGGDSFD